MEARSDIEPPKSDKPIFCETWIQMFLYLMPCSLTAAIFERHPEGPLCLQ